MNILKVYSFIAQTSKIISLALPCGLPDCPLAGLALPTGTRVTLDIGLEQ